MARRSIKQLAPGVFITISNFCSLLAPHSLADRARISRPRNLGGGCSFPMGAAFQAQRVLAMQSSFAAAMAPAETFAAAG
jgi:hypothetical protein